jgi:amino acid transporter
MNRRKKLSLFAIVMMNVVIVANLQMMTATAVYGYQLIFFYLVAGLTFFLPCMLIIAELSTAHPITGGSYIWVERAFGKRWGFFAGSLVWLSNVIWYPTIFSLLATIIAYIVAPTLATNTLYTIGTAIVLFWTVTLLNAFGIRVSSLVSSLCSVTGIILPTLILIGLGAFWLMSGHPSEIPFSFKSLIPDFTGSSRLAFLTQVVISLVGIEMSAVHAGDMQTPKRMIPRAMWVSSAIILLIVVLAPLAIALVIPQTQIGIVSGLIDALQAFFRHLQIPALLFLVMLALVFLGNFGSTAAWMIGSTRGMQVASRECHMPLLFQKTNRHKAPIGILLLEGVIFTLLCSLFFFSTISNSYWILLQLASQITLLYYLLIFAAAIKLKKELASHADSFRIPGGTRGTLVAAILATVTALTVFVFGFFPPDTGTVSLGALYAPLMILGVIACLGVPFFFLKLSRK